LYLLTAKHVVRGELGTAKSISVQFYGDRNTTYPAELFRYDPTKDVAVLLLRHFLETRHLDRLTKYTLDRAFTRAGGSASVKAIGHPGDREWHVSYGTAAVTAGSDELTLPPDIATHGNSGGPLLSGDNRLVGMVTGGEGSKKAVALSINAITPLLDERPSVPYKVRILEPMDATIEALRKAAWDDKVDSLRSEQLEGDTRHGVWRARIGLIGNHKAILVQHTSEQTYIELLGQYRLAAQRQEAWRAWRRAIADAIRKDPEKEKYHVEEKSPTRVLYWKYKGLDLSAMHSRRVTFDLIQSSDSIYLLVYQYKTDMDDYHVGWYDRHLK
jgi:hypothetical protein